MWSRLISSVLLSRFKRTRSLLRKKIPCLREHLCLFISHLLFSPCVRQKKGQQVALTRTKFAVASFLSFPCSISPLAVFWFFWKKKFIVFLGFYFFHLQCTPGFFGHERQSCNDVHYCPMVGSSNSFLNRMWFGHIWQFKSPVGESKGIVLRLRSAFLWFLPTWVDTPSENSQNCSCVWLSVGSRGMSWE